LGIAVAIVGLYVLLPKLVGVSDAFNRIGEATWYWIVVAVGFVVVAFAAYAAVFKAVVGGGPDAGVPRGRLNLRASYEITMAGFAGSTFFSAAGAGGLIIVYWALRKAGMEARRAACRMVALLVILYSFYAASLIVFGILLSTGVLHGSHPAGGTIVPAGVAGALFVVAVLIALIPGDFERRIAGLLRRSGRTARVARRLASIPGTVATGVRTAWDRLRDPDTALLAVGGGLLYWAGNIGVLWASFHAYGVEVPLGVVVQGFFVGMAANVIPSPAAGVGPVDAGMIAAFLLFDIPKESVFPAVLTYRLIAFWLPTIPGIIAYLQLRRTVRGWEQMDARGYTSESKVLETT
ncbi:MAG TPA: lysylphosphatidylglycerol synthase transmembrane domain-containing protein, partial [Thermoleophilaceae bacterium]|nr:lysylphosphatidylglycerol synthase transmembrane domain-containing protein [Thermoleophilaceae bacterium]